MSRNWWVNHKATVKHEIGGGYLWSPKREKNARSQFYDNMRVADVGELVLSYANGQIGHVGRVAELALDAPKPTEFGATGENWAATGWLLPVEWTALPSPVRPREIWEVLGPLMPSKYSPLVPSTGGGAQKAYLAEVSDAVFDAIFQVCGLDGWPDLSKHPQNTSVADQLEHDLEKAIERSVDLNETEKIDLIQSRRGQGKFRAGVAEIEAGCRVTGVTDPALLVASHIKPWRSCETGTERLDGHNGLLLTPNIDRLFDRGLIAFQDDGGVLISPKLGKDSLQNLGLENLGERNVGRFSKKQSSYLEYHRSSVFKSEN